MDSMFVTEAEVEEEKKRKQENWEKTRHPDQPLLVPEEAVEHRSLYEQLKEQKDKKDSEWEEAHKFKNQFRGLEGEEVDFINAVDEQKEEIERQKKQEEDELIREFRTTNSRVVKVPSLVDKLGLSIKPLVPCKRKRSTNEEVKDETKKAKITLKSESNFSQNSASFTNNSTEQDKSVNTSKKTSKVNATNTDNNSSNTNADRIQVVGMRPSLVAYAASDEEESHSDTDTSASSDDDLSFQTACIFKRPARTCKQ